MHKVRRLQLDGLFDGQLEIGRSDGAKSSHAERLGEGLEIGIGEVRANETAAEVLLLDAADITEQRIVEHDWRHREARPSPYTVAVLASGSLSHKLTPFAETGDDRWDQMGGEFNRQMDLRVLELWREGRFAEFVHMLADYSTKCNGEALMADTHMLFGLLGWDGFHGSAEELCPYFPSSGSGRINVEFHLPER
jgi:3,4-dihydroxyphenylacetate 2,3-dioxygenase